MSPEAIGIVIGSSIAFLGGIVNVIVNAIVQVKNTRRAKEAEERKHYRELMFNAALEHWKHDYTDPNRRPPLEQYISRMYAFYAAFVDENFDPAKVKDKVDSYKLLSEIHKDNIERKDSADGAT